MAKNNITDIFDTGGNLTQLLKLPESNTSPFLLPNKTAPFTKCFESYVDPQAFIKIFGIALIKLLFSFVDIELI